MPDTPLQFIGTGFRFISWETLDPEFMRLVYRRLVRNGISRFVVLDPMHDLDATLATAPMIREEGGAEIVGALTYTMSDVARRRLLRRSRRPLRRVPELRPRLHQGPWRPADGRTRAHAAPRRAGGAR